MKRTDLRSKDKEEFLDSNIAMQNDLITEIFLTEKIL